MTADRSTNLLRAIEVFVAIMETRQVTQAAAQLAMTQSAASQHLANLEIEFGAPLFDRSSRPMEPTPAGLALHRRAGRILDEMEDLRSEMRRLGPIPIALLRVGSLASIATVLTDPILKTAQDEFSIPEVVLRAGLAPDHEVLLRARKVDIVVTSDPLFDLDGLIRLPLVTETFLLVLPQSYASSGDNLDAVVDDLPLVRFTTEAPVGRRTDQHLRRIRQAIPRTISADRTSMIMAAVATGRGFAILPPTLLLDGVAEHMEVRVRPLPAPSFQRTITLLAREDELGFLPEKLATQCTDTLMAAVHDRLPTIPTGHFKRADESTD